MECFYKLTFNMPPHGAQSSSFSTICVQCPQDTQRRGLGGRKVRMYVPDSRHEATAKTTVQEPGTQLFPAASAKK